MREGKRRKKGGRGQRGRGFAAFFLLVSFASLGWLTFLLCLTHDVSPAHDEALFLRAGADTETHLYYNAATDGSYQPVPWEAGSFHTGSVCVPVSLADLPSYLPDAFVAMEDHRFYRHGGVDFLRTARAAFSRLFGKGDFGGSTITQQLVKNIGGERDRTVLRKLREMTRAQMLEARHTKEEILSAYLGIVPMDEGLVGVGAAARAYFGKEASELSLAEAASLAAITPAPARLSPRRHPEENRARRSLVLARMAALGYITEEERAAADAEPLLTVAARGEETRVLPWYAEHALGEVKAGLLAEGYTPSAVTALLYGGGLHIYTALDPLAQRAAEEALATHGEEGFHAATVVFSPFTGKLVALVGDLGEKRGERLFNYATDMRRAPGSALKPLALFAPALEEGLITEATVFDDVPLSFSGTTAWPHNTPDRYDGLILAGDALARSKNTVAVALYRKMGAEHIYAVLRDRFRLSGLCRRAVDERGGVRTDLAEAPLALGELTYGESLFSLTRAYLPFCKEGEITAGSSFYRVTDGEGRVLLTAKDAPERVLSPMTASVMTHLLAGVVTEGSAKTLTLPALVDTAGKTGSSGGNRDRWFIGYTPKYLCGVWCGYAQGGKAVEGTPHLRLFDAVMKPLHESLPDEASDSFRMAEGLKRVTVCMDSGKMPTILCKEDERGERTTEVWVPRSLHLDACDAHVSVFYDDALDGVAYPPGKGREGSLRRVSLVRVPDRAFPIEVTVTDAEYVYRDPAGTLPSGEDAPFFSGSIPKGVYVGRSGEGRPFNAAARAPLAREETPPPISDTEEGVLRRRPPTQRRRRRLPRFSFFGF